MLCLHSDELMGVAFAGEKYDSPNDHGPRSAFEFEAPNGRSRFHALAGRVAQRTLCETEVRASQSEPICFVTHSRTARRLLESARFGKRRANSNRYATQRLPSSPINLTGNARSTLLPERVPRGRAQGSVADYSLKWISAEKCAQ
jgi:hypothetical protein